MQSDLDELTFQARYDALHQEYLAALPQRRNSVAETWALCTDDAQSPAWCELQALAHRLSGSAPCYGLEAIGVAAHRIDRRLSSKVPCRDAVTLEPMVAALLAALDAA